MKRTRIFTGSLALLSVVTGIFLFQTQLRAANTVNQPIGLQGYFTPRVELSPWFTFVLTSAPSSTETIGYTIEIDDANNFATPVYKYTQSSMLTQGTHSHQIPRKIITQDGTYYWRVTAHNVDNTSSNTSAIQTLSFSNCVPIVSYNAGTDRQARIDELIRFDGTASESVACGLLPGDNDGDGIADGIDNCPYEFNPSQEDDNGNGVGNACEQITCNEPNTWSRTSPLPEAEIRGFVATLHTMGTTLYAGGPMWPTLDPQTISKSTDSGRTWLETGPLVSDPDETIDIRVINSEGNTLLAAGSTDSYDPFLVRRGMIFRSTNGGDSWTRVGNFPGLVYALDYFNGTWYAGTSLGLGGEDATIYTSTNNGQSWETFSTLSDIRYIHDFELFNSQLYFAGGKYTDRGEPGLDISTVRKYNDTTDSWEEVPGVQGREADTLLVFNSELFVGVWQNQIGQNHIYKTTDGIQFTPVAIFTGQLQVFDLHAMGDTMYAATAAQGRVYKSTNGGASWVNAVISNVVWGGISLDNVGDELFVGTQVNSGVHAVFKTMHRPCTGSSEEDLNLGYRWIWGDGTTCPASFPGTPPAEDFFTCTATETHTYTDDGLYTPTLLVRDIVTGRMNWYTTTIMVGDQMDLYTVGRYKDSTDNGGNDFASLIDAPVRVVGRDTQNFEIIPDTEYQLEVGPQAIGQTSLIAATPGAFRKYEEDFSIPISTLPKAFSGDTIPAALYTDLKCIAGKECDFSTVRLYTDPALTDEYKFEDNSGEPYGAFGFRSRSTNPDKNFLMFFDPTPGAAWRALSSLNLAPEKVYPNEYSLTHLLADGITAVESYLLASKGLIDTTDQTLHALEDPDHLFSTDNDGHLLIKLSDQDTKIAGMLALEFILEQVLERSTVPLNPFTVQLEIRPDVLATDAPTNLSQTQLTVRELEDRRPMYVDDALLGVYFNDDTATARDGATAAVTGATYAQGVIFTGALPPASQAITLNATTNLSYSETPDVDIFDEDNGTIGAWIRPTWNGNDNQGHVVFDNYQDANNYLRIHKTPTNMLSFEMRANGTTFTSETSIASWTENTWYFVAGTWDEVQSTMTLYINGRPVAQTNPITTPITLSTELNVGWSEDPALSGRTLNARLDDFFIFTRALNSTEVRDWHGVYLP